MDQHERMRIAALIAADGQDAAEEQIAQLRGERLRVTPSRITSARRAAQANGMSEQECTDTIGRLWAWGCLDGARYASDLLRDAGRRYAAAYWFRYGPVCGHVGAYADVTRASGKKTTVIPDEQKDEISEFRFRRRDEAVRALKGDAKKLVDSVTVDGHGDNDPAWLTVLISGYPIETAELRAVYHERKSACGSGSEEAKRRAQRLADDARRALANTIRELRAVLLPTRQIATIRDALCELADCDRAEGLHKPKRHSLIICEPD